MNLKIAALAFGACFVTPLTHARACSAPPVRNSQQAACYASAYAEKNKLAHDRPFARQVTRGARVWTVRFADKRPNGRGAGWEVDVDAASGTVTRFLGYKERER